MGKKKPNVVKMRKRPYLWFMKKKRTVLPSVYKKKETKLYYFRFFENKKTKKYYFWFNLPKKNVRVLLPFVF